ncbi:MAG: HupE/UreJ family protein [Deltaproteobacteria bacterium]|nr:HupE/UreJ family protein [Deltaproteobacteria bacterium]
MNSQFRTKRKQKIHGIAAALAILLWPSISQAHLVNTGLGPFYDGISHLAMSPDDLLSALALALLAGLSGARAGRKVLFLLPPIWLLGGLFGLRMEQEVSLPLFSILSFLVTGALVALDRRLPLLLISALTCCFGFLHGFLNGSAMAQAGGGFLALFGISVTVFVLVALVAALVVSLKAQWARITVRVAGSWITAIGLLMLGWAYKGIG